MSKFVATDLDFNQNEIQNAVEQNLATAPSNPKEGQKYWNTAQKKLFIYDGNKWVDATNQGKTYIFTDGLTEEEGTDVVTLDLATSSSIGGVIVGNNIDVNDTATISVKDATNTQKGVIQIATDEEVATGIDTTKAVNPLQLNNAVKDKITKTDLSATAPIKYNNSTGVISADIDNTPTADSTKLVSSGGVKAELDKKVDANVAIAGATKCKITYDEKGLVTAGADLAAADIPNLDSAKINTLDNYAKAATFAAIEKTDTLNVALGKLEKGLDTKQATITGAATTIVDADLTASMILVSDAQGKVAASAIPAATAFLTYEELV